MCQGDAGDLRTFMEWLRDCGDLDLLSVSAEDNEASQFQQDFFVETTYNAWASDGTIAFFVVHRWNPAENLANIERLARRMEGTL